MSDTENAGLLAERFSEARGLVSEIAAFTALQVRATLGLIWRVRVDVILAVAVGVLVSAYALMHWFQITPVKLLSVFDIWFESDMPRIAGSLTDRVSCMHDRTNVHPLASLLLASPTIALHALGVSAVGVITGYVAAGAFAFGALLFATLRTMKLARIDSALVAGLTATSAAAMFWLAVPENYSWGGVTILVSMLWLAAPRGEHDVWTGPLQSAISFCITITNWMAGLIAAFLALGVRRAILVSVSGLMIICVLEPLQYVLYPHAGGFLNVQQEKLYSVLDSAKTTLSPVRRVVAMADHVFVAPKYVVLSQDEHYAPFKLSYQTMELAGDPAAVIALAGWFALLGLGVWAAIKKRVPKIVAAGVGLVLLANVLLHMVYGEEVFLYSMHFISLYALIAGWACLGFRRIALPLIVMTAVASHLHNTHQFVQVVDIVNSGRLWPHITGPLIPPCPQ